MDIKFTMIGGASWTIEVDGKFKIGCDPFLAPKGTNYDFGFFKSRRSRSPVYTDDSFKDVRLWLLTHNHADHIDSEGISKIDGNSYIIARANCKKLLANYNKVIYLNWNKSIEYVIGGYTVDVKAIPAYHGNNIVSSMLAGKVNGYLLKINMNEETRIIYITADTVYSKKVIKALTDEKIDYLIPNMGNVKSNMWGGPLTLSTDMLKRMVNLLEPKLVIPVHIDDFLHYETKRAELEEYLIIDNGESKVLD